MTTTYILLALLWLFTILIAAHQRNVYLRTTSLQIEQLFRQIAMYEEEIQRLRHEVQQLKTELKKTTTGEGQ